MDTQWVLACVDCGCGAQAGPQVAPSCLSVGQEACAGLPMHLLPATTRDLSPGHTAPVLWGSPESVLSSPGPYCPVAGHGLFRSKGFLADLKEMSVQRITVDSAGGAAGTGCILQSTAPSQES